MIRKMNNISDNALSDVFKISHLKNDMIKIKLGSGKGGSFFVIPKNSSYLIKSITITGKINQQNTTEQNQCWLIII